MESGAARVAARGPLSRCPHVVNIRTNWKQIQTYAAAARCKLCYSNPTISKETIWLCLEANCGFLGCGESGQDHINTHYEASRHTLCINLNNKRIYCATCDCEVSRLRNEPPIVIALTDSRAGSDLLTSTAAAKPLSPNHQLRAALASAAAHDDINYEEDEMEDELDKPRGLSGLRNLGNTCYMNATLQALSNCNQLTRFFLDCECLVKSRLKQSVSLAYSKLLNEMWHQQRPNYVVPTTLCYAMRLVQPSFRGFSQQDAQEFLRCFMDQLHEELKWRLPQRPYSSSLAEDFTVADLAHSAGVGLDEQEREDDHMDKNKELLASSDGVANTLGSNSNTVHRRTRPSLYRSIVSDIFDGRLLSSVQCLSCERISSTVETFQDLSLPIPSKEQLGVLRQTRVASSQSVLSGTRPIDAQNLLGQSNSTNAGTIDVTYKWINWFYLWMRSWFRGPMITLQDCLAAFFSADELKGDNMYSCERCKKLRSGMKFSRIIHLPEVLCIHLKRFRHDFSFCSKINSFVSFPLEGLELQSYLHHNYSCRSNSGSLRSVYDLTGVIVHHGSANGGHYTSYALNHTHQQWYEFDDCVVTKVDQHTVENAEAYVLFYRKREDQSILNLRAKASELQQLQHEDESLMRFWISRAWICKFNSFSEPGPITNEDFLCQHGAVAPAKLAMNTESELAMEVNHATWKFLQREFGGGPAVTHLHCCDECAEDERKLKERQHCEYETVMRIFERFRANPRPASIYAISLSWFRIWEDFARERQSEPPGPIDNNAIVVHSRSNTHDPSSTATQIYLKTNSDYGQISREIWRFLVGIYGGGPEVKIVDHEPEVSEEEADELFEPVHDQILDSLSPKSSDAEDDNDIAEAERYSNKDDSNSSCIARVDEDMKDIELSPPNSSAVMPRRQSVRLASVATNSANR